MRKKGVDHDNVLVEVMVQYLKFYNERFRTSYTVNDLKEYRLEACLRKSPEEIKALTLEFYNTPYFEKVKPVKDSQWGVSRLRKAGNELYDITSRPEIIAALTEKELAKYFPNAFQNVVFTDDYLRDSGGKGKAAACLELEIGTLVEDSWEYAKACAEQGIKVFLMDRPWNCRKPAVDGVERCRDWKDFVRKIGEL